MVQETCVSMRWSIMAQEASVCVRQSIMVQEVCVLCPCEEYHGTESLCWCEAEHHGTGIRGSVR